MPPLSQSARLTDQMFESENKIVISKVRNYRGYSNILISISTHNKSKASSQERDKHMKI